MRRPKVVLWRETHFCLLFHSFLLHAAISRLHSAHAKQISTRLDRSPRSRILTWCPLERLYTFKRLLIITTNHLTHFQPITQQQACCQSDLASSSLPVPNPPGRKHDQRCVCYLVTHPHSLHVPVITSASHLVINNTRGTLRTRVCTGPPQPTMFLASFSTH